MLANSNPATIQTDLETADVVYLEPLNAATIEKILEREKPDGFIATMSGQTGLNLAVELKDVLKKHNVQVLGTSIETIELAEDRKKFADLLAKIGEPCAASMRVKNMEEAMQAMHKLKLPLMVRPDYCLGGTGSAIARNESEFTIACENGFLASTTHELLLEKSLEGLAEMEYEVIRDARDNCITICNMENIDPMGVHTGESVVVAPCQTLSDDDHQKLRSAAIKIVRALGVQGACNIQFALNQETGEYWVVEVNPRASRSSALASKATGYPIARVAAKIALGYDLTEIENKITGKTACFEPALDYVVIKIPRWPFDKIPAERVIGTRMKSTGETMAIGRNFEEAFQKALRSLDSKAFSDAAVATLDSIKTPNPERLHQIKQLLKNGGGIDEIHAASKINKWFLHKLAGIVAEEKLVIDGRVTLRVAKQKGFSNTQLAELSGKSTSAVRSELEGGVGYKMVDTCSGEFEALTPYYYSTYNGNANEATGKEKKRKVVILGSGPIRIGQGIEFDYSTVHAVSALKEHGFEAIIINNNPETVSTDFDVSNKLYFEPITLEDVLNVVKNEGEIEGVMVQFGGQTAINLAHGLHENGVKLLGTSFESIDATEDRKKFKKLMKQLRIPLVESGLAFDEREALEIAEYVGYPVLIRPSYVLGGRAMELVKNAGELKKKIGEIIWVSEGRPIIIDHFLEDAVEVDVDALGDGKNAFIAGIMQQIEEAGVHSGDSACVLPAVDFDAKMLEKIEEYATKIIHALEIKGFCNIQMAVKGNNVFVIEVNPRASRTIPYVSKAIGLPLAKIAALIQVGENTLEELKQFKPAFTHYAVKVPVFPFSKFPEIDPLLNAEMKSTGETMAFGSTPEEAYLKALRAAGHEFGTTCLLGNWGKWQKTLEKKLATANVRIIKPFSVKAIEQASFVLSNAAGEEEVRRHAIQLKKPVITSAFAAIKILDALKKAPVEEIISLNEAIKTQASKTEEIKTQAIKKEAIK